MFDQSSSQLITAFQREVNPRFKHIFVLLILLTVIVLFFFRGLPLPELIGIGIVLGLCVVGSGITALRDKAQRVEIYRDGMIIREGKDNADVEEIPWAVIDDIKAVYTSNQSTSASTASGSFGFALLSIFLSQVAKEPTVPDELVLRFKANQRKLKLDRACHPVFTDLQRAALDTWLAEANAQLERGEYVRIGEWQVSQQGILTSKQTIPWAAIRSMHPYLEGVQLNYWDEEKKKDQQTYQKLDLRGEVLNALKKQIQNNTPPTA